MKNKRIIGFANDIIGLCKAHNNFLDEIIKETKSDNPHIFTLCSRFKIQNEEEIKTFKEVIEKWKI